MSKVALKAQGKHINIVMTGGFLSFFFFFIIIINSTPPAHRPIWKLYRNSKVLEEEKKEKFCLHLIALRNSAGVSLVMLFPSPNVIKLEAKAVFSRTTVSN